MKNKKEGKTKSATKQAVPAPAPIIGEINNESDMKLFLLNIRDKMAEEIAPAVFAVAALNQILTSLEISALLNNENKEIARDIWLRIKQAGFQMRNPIMLFGACDSEVVER